MTHDLHRHLHRWRSAGRVCVRRDRRRVRRRTFRSILAVARSSAGYRWRGNRGPMARRLGTAQGAAVTRVELIQTREGHWRADIVRTVGSKPYEMPREVRYSSPKEA